MHHVAGADGPGTRGRLDHQTAGVVDGRRPPISSSPARITRTRWPSVAQRRRTSSARTRRPAASSSSSHRGSSASRRRSRRTWRSTGCAVPPTSSRQVPPASAGPGQATLIPMPTMTALRAGPANSASARTPASLAPSSSRSLGHLRTGSTPATSRQASAPASATAPAHRCTSSAAQAGPEEDRGQEVRPRRRLPAPVEAAPAGGLMVGHRDEPGGMPPGEPDHGRRCWSNRPRRASGCPTPRPTWQTP